MTSPNLHYDNPVSISDLRTTRALALPAPVTKRCARGFFRPGLCVTLIQPDGGEERRVACWTEADGRISLEEPRRRMLLRYGAGDPVR